MASDDAVRVASFRPLGGASGDMILGSLIDAGLDIAWLTSVLRQLDLPPYRLSVDRVRRAGVEAVRFLVRTEGYDDHHHQKPTPGRSGPNLAELTALLDAAEYSPQARLNVLMILRRLVRAEARVAQVEEAVFRFHPVSVIDTMVDVVGAVLGFERLGIERIASAPLPLGSGTIETRHGMIPRTGAVTRLVVEESGFPADDNCADGQQVTATGAAILTTLAEPEREKPSGLHVGFGAGKADLAIPNVLEVRIIEDHSACRFPPATEQA